VTPASQRNDVRGHPSLAVVTMAGWGPAFPRVAHWLGRGLVEIDAHADVVYLDGRPDMFGPFLQSAEGALLGATAGGAVREVELGAARARSSLPRLVGYLRERRPAVTLATPGAIGSLAMVAGALTGCVVVPWEATVPRMDRADVPQYVRPMTEVGNFLYRRSPLVAAVSHGVRDALVETLGRRFDPARVVVLPNPVDVAEIRRLATPGARRSGRFRLCSVGRLASAKGFDVLVDALALADLHVDWELLIVGGGPLRGDLERRVAARGLGDRIRFTGQLDNPYPVLASADIAVQASRWEGFGIAVVEALALGVPMVATSCPGGVGDVLDGGRFGLLVPPDDPAALAGALRRLVGDGELRGRLAETGPTRAATYAPAEVARRALDLVRLLCVTSPEQSARGGADAA
jgi:glycosyltransferase involved in cell wall biosynthesis